jgi:hypothetical protein
MGHTIRGDHAQRDKETKNLNVIVVSTYKIAVVLIIENY